jgi:uncharacterized protein (TIGR02117 family)
LHANRAATAALALILALTGCSAAGLPAPRRVAAPADAVLDVVGRGWHTDIGLPVTEIRGPLAALQSQFPGVRYLVFGFGERAYLLSREKTLAQMVGALFPGPGVMLVTALATTPEAAFGPEHVIVLRVPQAGVDRVADFLWRYLGKGGAGVPAPLASGPYPGSLFYESRGSYALGHTCNTWTAEALHTAGLPIEPGGVLFASQVWRRARQLAAAQAERLPAPAVPAPAAPGVK